MEKTPLQKCKKLQMALGLSGDLFFKREDLHPLGSHKGRSIPIMIEKHMSAGFKNFVISSSGNAALASALYVNEYNHKYPNNKIGLKIFVGKNVDTNKQAILLSHCNNQVIIEQVSNPKQQAFQMEKSGQAKNLRQSTDDTALVGYEELGAELAEIKKLSAIFIPTSSGTTAQGLYSCFQKLGLNPQIHVVQTTTCHPLVSTIVPKEKSSLATAIVDKVAHRKSAVAEAIKNSRGNGWIATNDEITQAMNLVKQKENLEISPNSALSVAGFIHSINAGWKFNGPIVCLITGK